MKDNKHKKSVDLDVQKSEINHKKLKAVIIATAIIGVLIAIGIILSLFFSNRSDDFYGNSGAVVLPVYEHSSSSEIDGIQLCGIVYTEESLSYAVIMCGEDTFTLTENEKIGDSGWKITEIRSNDVVITKGLREQVLDFSGIFEE